MPIKNDGHALRVNWMELAIMETDLTFIKHLSFITGLPITEANTTDMICYERSRWKIENENNNILKIKGYHLEHNFGHGSPHLSNGLMRLNPPILSADPRFNVRLADDAPNMLVV